MQTRDDSEWSCESQDVPKGISDETFPNVPEGDLSRLGGPDGYSWHAMIPFWQAYRPWLEARGFRIFEARIENIGYGYFFPPPTQCPAVLPYALFADVAVDPSISRPPPPKFTAARDTHMRDVIIKLTEKGSDEHRIYEELLHCSELSGEEFHGILPPVAILDSRYNFSFVVMPRWGDFAPLEDLDTVGGVMALMRCLLKSLAFLHSHRIVHRDIDFHNIMVNLYTFGPYRTEFTRMLDEHRRGPNALHCLVDFDRSLKFPSGASLDACRLPAEAALVSATPYQPLDLNLGEHDYDPFAFDVGCLGNMFRITYADVLPMVPMLAPLFDQMTTHVISERLKAADALAFFESATGHLQGDVLDMQVDLEPNWDHLDDSNIYWSKLPADFSKTQGLYRTPPPSLARRLLNVFASYRIGWRILMCANNEDRPSTRVRVYLWSHATTEFAHPSVDGGRPFSICLCWIENGLQPSSIQHKHLTPVDPNVRPRGGWKLDTLVTLNIPPNVTYRTEHFPLDDRRGPMFQIPNSTVCVVRKCMTGTNRLRTADQEANSNRTDWWYVVSVKLRKKGWSWVQCQEWVSVLSLQRLVPEEEARMDAFINSTSGPPEIIVI